MRSAATHRKNMALPTPVSNEALLRLKKTAFTSRPVPCAVCAGALPSSHRRMKRRMPDSAFLRRLSRLLSRTLRILPRVSTGGGYEKPCAAWLCSRSELDCTTLLPGILRFGSTFSPLIFFSSKIRLRVASLSTWLSRSRSHNLIIQT